MILAPDDIRRVFNLHMALFLFVNDQLRIGESPPRSAGTVALPIEQRLEVQRALVEHRDQIDAFVEANPYALDSDELADVRSWRDFVAGEFYVVRYLKKHTIFVVAREPNVAYGVLGLSQPLDEVIPHPLPYYCRAVLLPFRGRIVYDGMLSGYDVAIGRNMARGLNDVYNEAKKRHGVVTSLPFDPAASKPARRSTPRQGHRGRARGLVGRWRIVWPGGWDPEDEGAELQGFLQIGREPDGEFEFADVHGELDYREVEQDGKPGIEFSWDGGDHLGPAHGRGWATRVGDEIEGQIFCHGRVGTGFRAVKRGR